MNLYKSTFLILLWAVAFFNLNYCNVVEQRSKEANCLIIGYQKCIINYSNITNSNHENQSAKLLLKNSATDCWRYSRTNDAKNSLQINNCKEDECLFGGGCVNSVVDENDGYHTTENLPISAFYDDAHTITISFPTYLDTVLYVLESRPLATEGKPVQPWTFAGVSNETSISYRILDICQKYEFRPTAILNNGTVISFLPKVPTANPPDFIVDTLKLDKMYYEESEKKAVAVFLWKKPYGYTTKDVVKYDSYLHATQCDISGEYAITKKLVKTEDGGAFRVEFPENMIRRKCKFLLTVWAHNICGAKTVTDASANLELICSRIEGYKCPDSELKPKCITHIVMAAVAYDSSKKLASVNASWLPHGSNTPQYYHVKWGPADLVDMQRRPPPPPPVGQHRFDQPPEFEPPPPPSADDPEPPHGPPPPPPADGPEPPHDPPHGPPHGPPHPPPPDGPEPPHDPPHGPPHGPPHPPPADGPESPHGPPPGPGPSNRGFDLSVWHLRKDFVKNEKVDGTSSTITLTDLHISENYGIQVCAIYNADFKTPDWPAVPVSGFTCLCTGHDCDAQSSLKCQDPDWFQLNKEKTTDLLSPTAFPSTTRLNKVDLPAPMPPGVESPSTKSIGPVEDFTQTLIGWEYNGLRMSLNWNPPSGLSDNQMTDYRVSLESLRDCNETQICCNFAQFPETKQETKNSSEVSLLVSKDVLRANCQFMVKIIAVSVNGAQSISLKNIVVPKPVVDSDMMVPDPIATSGPVVKGLSQDDISSGVETFPDKMSSKPNPLPTIKSDTSLTSKNGVINNCSHLECSHNCDDTHCLCPEGFSLSNDNKTCAISNNTKFVPPITDAMLARCQEFGCQYSCNSKNECICPPNMNLTENGKTCTYKDPDSKTMTAPPPLATTTPDAGYWCLQEEDQVSIVKTNWDVYIIWNNNQSWVEDKMEKNYKSPIVVRWGEIKTIPFVNLHKMINETVTSMTDLSTRKLFIGRLNPNKQYGFQFCVFKNDQAIGTIDWKLPTVLTLAPISNSQDPSSSRSKLPSTGVGKGADDDGSYVKKLIVMAVVIPLCCLIIVISLSILLCHFYPKPFRIVVDKLCSKNSSRSSTNDGLSKNRSSLSLGVGDKKLSTPTNSATDANVTEAVKTSLEA